MMYWGNAVGWWGYALMILTTVLFWGLIVAGIIALARFASHGGLSGGRPGGPPAGPPPPPPTAQQVLAERFARGEIDEEEYRRRLQVLSGTTP